MLQILVVADGQPVRSASSRSQRRAIIRRGPDTRTAPAGAQCLSSRNPKPIFFLNESAPFLSNRPAFDRLNDKALEASLQSSMGLHELEEVDLSLADGHRIFYEREVPFELRSAQGNEEPREVGAPEAIRVKILALGNEGAYTGLRVELTSESNLFFHYVHELDIAGFKKLQQGQNLMVDFADISERDGEKPGQLHQAAAPRTSRCWS